MALQESESWPGGGEGALELKQDKTPHTIQIRNSKFETLNKSQIQMTKIQNVYVLSVWCFEH